MTDRITAPWTEDTIAALNAFQRSGRMHPFTCGNEQHRMHQTLIAEADGWHCPDETCDYRQNWAPAVMADPNYLAAIQRPGVAEHLALFEAARFYGSPMAAELQRVRQELRKTEDDLGEERRRNAELAGRLAELQRGQALQIHEAQRRIAAVDVPCGELLHGQTINDVITTQELL
jgi:hypothetical protein